MTEKIYMGIDEYRGIPIDVVVDVVAAQALDYTGTMTARLFVQGSSQINGVTTHLDT